MRRILAAGILASSGFLSAAEPDDLIQKLGAPQFQARETAARELLKMGAAALPALQSAIQTTENPGIRERAESLLPKLERIAESERILAPQSIALNYTKTPLSTIIEDFKKKTGLPLVLVPEKVVQPMRPITIAKGELPIWEAMHELCLAAGLKEDYVAELPLPKGVSNQDGPRYYGGRGGFAYYGGMLSIRPYFTPSTAPILLVDGEAEALSGSRTSSIRVQALPGTFAANRVVRGAGVIVLNLEVTPLPKLNWNGATRVRVVRAEDEDGRPLFADEKELPAAGMPNDYSNNMIWGGRMMLQESVFLNSQPITSIAHNPRLAPVTLRTDDRAIKRLTKFEGVVLGEIHRPNEPVITIDRIENQLNKVYQGSHQMKLSITSYQVKETGGTSLRIHVEMPQAVAMGGLSTADDLNIGNVQNRLQFFDAKGNRCKNPQQRSAHYRGSNWTQSYEAELFFPPTKTPEQGAGEPMKVVLVGTKVTTIEVPFALENVRLP